MSVSRTSVAASELGMRPATRVGSALDEASGGSETSSPATAAGVVVPLPAGALVPNVPVMPIWPQAART